MTAPRPPLCAVAVAAEYVAVVRRNGPWAVHNVGRANDFARSEIVWEVLETMPAPGLWDVTDAERDHRWDIATEAADIAISALRRELDR